MTRLPSTPAPLLMVSVTCGLSSAPASVSLGTASCKGGPRPSSPSPPHPCSTARPASMKLAHAINLFLGIIRRCYRRVLRTTTPSAAKKPPQDESAVRAAQAGAMHVPRQGRRGTGPSVLLQRARLDLPVGILAGNAGVASEVGLARDAGIAIELPLQPGYGHLSVWAAIVLAVGAAMAHRRIHAIEHRDARRHGLEILLAVAIGDVGFTAGDDDGRAVHRVEVLLAVFFAEQAAVPDAHGGHMRIMGRAIRHDPAA